MSVKLIGDFPPKYYLVESVLPKNNFFHEIIKYSKYQINSKLIEKQDQWDGVLKWLKLKYLNFLN